MNVFMLLSIKFQPCTELLATIEYFKMYKGNNQLIQNVQDGSIGFFLLLKFENKLEAVISKINIISTGQIFYW